MFLKGNTSKARRSNKQNKVGGLEKFVVERLIIDLQNLPLIFLTKNILYKQENIPMASNLVTLTTSKLLALTLAPSLVALLSTSYLVWRGVRDFKVRKQVKLSAQDIAELKAQMNELKQNKP